METCVLIPQELSLGVRKDEQEAVTYFLGESNLSVWTNTTLPQGTKIFPFQGTVRIDHLEMYSYLSPTDMRHRYGCYDEVTSVGKRKVRHCNWVRFVHHSMVYSQQVNVVGSKCKGEPVYEIIRSIPANTELIVYYLPESLMEEILAPTIQYFRYSIYRQTLSKILDAAPLDLSMSLLCRPCKGSLTLDVDGRKSVSSDSVASSNDLDSYIHQQTSKRKLKEKSLLPCEVCNKSFDRPSLLKRHMRTHTGEKPHVCDVCGKGFSTSSSLNTHRRIHSGEKPHQCGVCGKRFTASSNLYYHRMTHIKEKPHKCLLCSKSFPTPGDLKSHMYVHNGSWPYKCHICNRGFSKNTNLKNHLFLHTGHKPHACNLCSKRFALACNLRAHLKTHDTGGLQNSCQKCARRISTDSETCGLCSHSETSAITTENDKDCSQANSVSDDTGLEEAEEDSEHP